MVSREIIKIPTRIFFSLRTLRNQYVTENIMKNNIILSNLSLSLSLSLHNPQTISIPIQQKYPRNSLNWRYFRETYNVAGAFSRNPSTTYWERPRREKTKKKKKKTDGFAIACKTRYRNFRRHVLRITKRGLDRFRKQPARHRSNIFRSEPHH